MYKLVVYGRLQLHHDFCVATFDRGRAQRSLSHLPPHWNAGLTVKGTGAGVGQLGQWMILSLVEVQHSTRRAVCLYNMRLARFLAGRSAGGSGARGWIDPLGLRLRLRFSSADRVDSH